MGPKDEHNFIIKYLSNNSDCVDKLLALSWIVQAWKTMDDIAEDNKTISRQYLLDKLEKNCPVGVIKILLELDTDVTMRYRDKWILDLLNSGKDTNDILKGLVAGSRDPSNFNFGD
jgi:hypothetical protein